MVTRTQDQIEQDEQALRAGDDGPLLRTTLMLDRAALMGGARISDADRRIIEERWGATAELRRLLGVPELA